MRNTLITLLMLAAPRAALACPVCFGQSDSPMARAANLSILAMLVVVVGVLAGFAGFFVHLMRCARLGADEASGPAHRLRRGYSGPLKLYAKAEALREGGSFTRRRKLYATAEAGRRGLDPSSPQEGTAQC